MKKLFTFIYIFYLVIPAVGQEIYDLSQFSQVAPILNPAFTGVDDYLDVKVGYKKKWAGIKESPQSIYAGAFGSASGKKERSYRMSTSSENENQSIQKKHGFGGFIFNSSNGPFSHTRGLISYALHFPITEKSYFTLGTSTGITNFRFDPNKLNLRDQDQYYETLIGENISNTYIELSLGGLWYSDKFYLGYGVTPVAKNALNEQQVLDLPKNTSRHVINAGVALNLNADTKLLPGVLAKISNEGYEIDYSMKIRFLETIWAGVLYRDKKLISGMVGLFYSRQLNISYSFDYTLSDIKNYNNGSHEIVLGIMLFNNQSSLPYLW